MTHITGLHEVTPS